MQVINLASSSTGNCYVIYDGNNYLLLEAGLNYKDTIKALTRHQLKLTDFNNCLISHSHGDHNKSANNLSRFMTVIGTKETLKKVNGRKQQIEPLHTIFIKGYKIIPFNTEHDCDGSLGYIVTSLTTNESLLFATDTKYIRFNLSKFKFTHVMLECNYDDDVLGNIDLVIQRRLLNSHMGLNACINTLKALDLSKCESIYLLHLSDRHANEDKMASEIMKSTGVVTYICKKYGGIK